jgi:hypothetical protein
MIPTANAMGGTTSVSSSIQTFIWHARITTDVG